MYQIVWLGNQDPNRVPELSEALETGMRDLGVDPGVFLSGSLRYRNAYLFSGEIVRGRRAISETGAPMAAQGRPTVITSVKCSENGHGDPLLGGGTTP